MFHKTNKENPMSDQFPMPKSLDAPRATPPADYPRHRDAVPGFDRPATPPPPPSDYAPKRGLEAVAQAIEARASGTAAVLSQAPRQPLGQHTQAIRESIKLLTHREMREMVAMIFEAYKKTDGLSDAKPADALPMTISMARMADVLDRFAYGE